MKLKELIVILSACTAVAATAQDSNDAWSLQQCIEYAYAHNISIGQSRLSIESSAVDLREAKEQLFPSLSFSTAHDYSQSPYIDDPSQRAAIYNGSYHIDASWTLFDGGQRYYDIKSSRLSREEKELAAQETGYETEMEILSSYLQILYARESLDICKQSLVVSEEQEARGKALLEAGSISKSDYSQLAAQCANDRYQVVTAAAQADLLLVELKQLLNIDLDTTFDIVTPTFDEADILAPLPDRSTVLTTAMNSWPGIQQSYVAEKIAALDIKSAQAGYYPTISLTAGLSTGTLSGGGCWGDQMKANFGESIGISLTLPLYDNGRTRAAVARARIEALNTTYDREEKENNLAHAIESTFLDARSAQEQYRAAQENALATADAFELISEQFQLGIKNAFEMLSAQNDLLQARQEALQAKYMALLNRKLLEFYNNIPITLE